MSLYIHINRISFNEGTEEFKSLLDPGIKITEGSEIPHPANYEILVYPSPPQ